MSSKPSSRNHYCKIDMIESFQYELKIFSYFSTITRALIEEKGDFHLIQLISLDLCF